MRERRKSIKWRPGPEKDNQREPKNNQKWLKTIPKKKNNTCSVWDLMKKIVNFTYKHIPTIELLLPLNNAIPTWRPNLSCEGKQDNTIHKGIIDHANYFYFTLLRVELAECVLIDGDFWVRIGISVLSQSPDHLISCGVNFCVSVHVLGVHG